MMITRSGKHKSDGINEYSTSPGMNKVQFQSEFGSCGYTRKEPVILHVDMDAFFASVEQKERPWLVGKPVVVGGDPQKRHGVVTAASYAAREYGIKAGMPLLTAKRLCPHAVFLIGTYGDKYEYMSSRAMRIFYQFTPQVEPYSIDEAFLDITGCERLFGPPTQLAKKLKEKIKRQLGLSCSVGIASNKLLAKLASSLNKPDGLTLIPKDKVKQILNPLEVTKLWGIGDKTAKILSSLGIHTLGELASYPVEVLKRKFGKNGEWLHLIANGIDYSQVISQSITEKSMGHERTLPEDISDPEEINSVLLALCGMVARRLREKRFVGRTITLRVRYSDFVSFTRSETIAPPTDSEHVILRVAQTLALDIGSGIRRVRLLGVSVSHLIKDEQSQQMSLPFVEYIDKRKKAYSVMDKIRDKFGEESIRWASAASFA
ncbi:MAG: DNA polymerase IV [candidate division Zixibacteria bacterium]|nr:DNA polymerase IV [candidate division Zixibacteria bacterium]